MCQAGGINSEAVAVHDRGELGWMGPAPAPGTGDVLGMFRVLVVGKVGLFATVTSLGDTTMDAILAWLF